MIKVKENGDVEPFSAEDILKFKRKYKGNKLQVLSHTRNDNPEPTASSCKHPHKYSDYYWAAKMIHSVMNPEETNTQASSMSSSLSDSKAAEDQAMSESTSSNSEECLEAKLVLVLHQVCLLEATIQVSGSNLELLPAIKVHPEETKEVEQASEKTETASDRSYMPGRFLDTQMDVDKYIAQLKLRLSGGKQRLILQFYFTAVETCTRKQHLQGSLVNTLRDKVYDLATDMMAMMELPEDKSAKRLARVVAEQLIQKVKDMHDEEFHFKRYHHHYLGISDEEKAKIHAQEKTFRKNDKNIIEGIAAVIPA
ncbi:hypothetical protein [Endozoicomonas elysicola]|uniref:Uncharacterized protein n=1 Tax=Endozoicomonas elysicola TaxID=305900 RepID=A0A081KAL0_9GAMM|nr:hypothetical protein [Endozoicomonas elysicola]KEI71186.1 hypothetical protein GV64_10920 [Endozoicomonas elysicola]